jgi:16S rRNA (guanine527-N7)-methyltransferase
MNIIPKAQIDRYVDVLLFWNRRINLTAVREPDEIRARHFDDSLSGAAHVPATARTLVDVGSGAGFPGAVIALARPDLQVTLVESNHKKAAFLEAIRREVPVPNITIRPVRIETMVERFDVATSRATFPLPEWLEIGASLVVPGGIVIGFEGSQKADLPGNAIRIPYAPGRALIVYVPRGTSSPPP